MQSLLDNIRNHTPQGFDFKWLGEWLRQVDLNELDMTGVIPFH